MSPLRPRRAARPRRLPRARPALERLEGRCVPAGTLTGVPFTSLSPQPVEGAPLTGQNATRKTSRPVTPAAPVTTRG